MLLQYKSEVYAVMQEDTRWANARTNCCGIRL